MDKKKKIIAFALSVGVLAVAGTLFMNGGSIGSLSSSVLSDKAPAEMSDTELNNEISRLSIAINGYPAAIQLKEQRLGMAVKKIGELTDDLEGFNKVCDAKTDEKRVAQEALTALVDSWIPLKAHLDDVAGPRDTRDRNLKTIENNTKVVIPGYQAQQKGLSKTSPEYIRLAGLITAAQNENKQLTKENTALAPQITRRAPQVKAAEAALNDTYKYLKDAYDKLVADKAQLELELADKNTQGSNLWKIENNKTVVIPGLESQQTGLSKTSAQYKALATQIANVKKENTALLAANKALPKKISDLQKLIQAQNLSTSKYSKAKAAVDEQRAVVDGFVMPEECGYIPVTQQLLEKENRDKGELEQMLIDIRKAQRDDEGRLPLLQAEQKRRSDEFIRIGRAAQLKVWEEDAAQTRALRAEKEKAQEAARVQRAKDLQDCLAAAQSIEADSVVGDDAPGEENSVVGDDAPIEEFASETLSLRATEEARCQANYGAPQENANEPTDSTVTVDLAGNDLGTGAPPVTGYIETNLGWQQYDGNGNVITNQGSTQDGGNTQNGDPESAAREAWINTYNELSQQLQALQKEFADKFQNCSLNDYDEDNSKKERLRDEIKDLALQARDLIAKNADDENSWSPFAQGRIDDRKAELTRIYGIMDMLETQLATLNSTLNTLTCMTANDPALADEYSRRSQEIKDRLSALAAKWNL